MTSVIKHVSFEEWFDFNDSYPYVNFRGSLLDFQRDCVQHCEPLMGSTVLGIFVDGVLAGLLSYYTAYLLDEKQVVNGKCVTSRSLLLNEQENSTPLIYINTIVVHPDFRKQGLASRLINYLEDNSTSEKYLMMFPVSVESQNLGDKLGFIFDSNVCLRLEDVVKPLAKL